MRLAVAILVSASLVTTVGAQPADPNKPDWAYAVPPPAPPRPANAPPAERPPPDLTPLSIAGSKFQFTRNKVQGAADDGSRTRVQPADWFPEEHPNPLPPIVALGDQSRGITACSLCHMPEGRGRTENGGIAGLTSEYFIEQMHNFASGARQSAEPRKTNAKSMAVYAKAMTEDEIKAAADYYAAIPWVTWTKVVETTTSPKVESHNGLWIPLTGDRAGSEPLGARIIEVPADPEATELKRDPHSGYIAYVPVGAVAAGKALATGGGGKTVACTGCHGADLMGKGTAPGIAGRTATYTAQQLYDMQAG
ncbi:MAG: hypothetical protein JO256_07565, partial [Alphaproteobacteria bacterium]|nr:hypothetical protein [Alphaproteobacteria bacterium]